MIRALVFLLTLTLAYGSAPDSLPGLSQSDRAFLEDLEQRSVLYFWEQADPRIGLVLDRAAMEGGRPKGPGKDVASSAATGFGLTALCIGAEHGWIRREEARQRARITLEFFATKAYQEHGWFYHWMDVSSGESRWDSELSTIDTALLLAGALTAAQCFSEDPEIPKLAKQIYDRVDFVWMLKGDSGVLSHGWIPGRRLHPVSMGYVQRSIHSLSARNRVSNPCAAARVLVCLAAALLHLWSIFVHERWATVHAPILVGVGGFSKSA